VADKDEKKKENRIQRFFRETTGELRKVSWPTPQEAWQLTRIVLLVLFVMAVLLGTLDYAFSRIMAAILT
jgi:preprotein translocase subunit SecE